MEESGGVVLLIAKDPERTRAVQEALAAKGFEVEVCASVERAERVLDQVHAAKAAAVVADGSMPGALQLAERVSTNTDAPVIVVNEPGNEAAAIAAVRAGVHDYLSSPAPGALAQSVQRAIDKADARAEMERLPGSDSEGIPEDGMLGESPAIQEAKRLIHRVAGADISVLLTGESGTGKELAARALHTLSDRREGPFVAINCAAVPSELLESELFGHAQGAFTGARTARSGLFLEAHGGTLFLDEVAEMPPDMQTKLLRALQEETVRPVGGRDEVPFDARVLAATNRDLEQEIEEGSFREDLYYRLNVVTVQLPPLRARGNDVLVLAYHFLRLAAQRQGRDVRGLSDPVAERLLRYDWPGNVRELANAMERAVALARYDHVTVDDLPEPLQQYQVPTRAIAGVPEMITLEDLERLHISRVLEHVEGNKSRAAHVLGIDRRTLYRKLQRYGL